MSRFTPQVQNVLKCRARAIEKLSPGSQELVMKTAEGGNVLALMQDIDYLLLGGDY